MGYNASKTSHLTPSSRLGEAVSPERDPGSLKPTKLLAWTRFRAQNTQVTSRPRLGEGDPLGRELQYPSPSLAREQTTYHTKIQFRQIPSILPHQVITVTWFIQVCINQTKGTQATTSENQSELEHETCPNLAQAISPCSSERGSLTQASPSHPTESSSS
ncbi:hypothetical protein DEO72_LG7g2049 [Vigna unguiculata]|uniref:Uncharacterized protein n=1 Tax=Vigna unguiculata TaxID=3917 RepID=A0A4D6MKS1_VIGUN|nr:hypothetical protein DEO72_LG7g2049 [Vigna unguiculata]